MVNEEGEIIEYFHDLVNTKEQEEEDSQEELMDDYDQPLSEAQDAHVVNDSNSSCAYKKSDSEQSHKSVFQLFTDFILKNEKCFQSC